MLGAVLLLDFSSTAQLTNSAERLGSVLFCLIACTVWAVLRPVPPAEMGEGGLVSLLPLEKFLFLYVSWRFFGRLLCTRS